MSKVVSIDQYEVALEVLADFYDWLEECTERQPGASTPLKDLYRSYQRWVHHRDRAGVKQFLFILRAWDIFFIEGKVRGVALLSATI